MADNNRRVIVELVDSHWITSSCPGNDEVNDR